MQVVLEDVVVDAQYGLRPGRSCAYIIFCVHQMVEKVIEYNTKIFLLFVDLQKAYNSVPRSAIWLVMQKYGIPGVMLDL